MQSLLLDEILSKLQKALRDADFQEIEKWEGLLKAELDFRERVRSKNREMREEALRIKKKQAYDLSRM